MTAQQVATETEENPTPSLKTQQEFLKEPICRCRAQKNSPEHRALLAIFLNEIGVKYGTGNDAVYVFENIPDDRTLMVDRHSWIHVKGAVFTSMATEWLNA